MNALVGVDVRGDARVCACFLGGQAASVNVIEYVTDGDVGYSMAKQTKMQMMSMWNLHLRSMAAHGRGPVVARDRQMRRGWYRAQRNIRRRVTTGDAVRMERRDVEGDVCWRCGHSACCWCPIGGGVIPGGHWDHHRAHACPSPLPLLPTDPFPYPAHWRRLSPGCSLPEAVPPLRPWPSSEGAHPTIHGTPPCAQKKANFCPNSAG